MVSGVVSTDRGDVLDHKELESKRADPVSAFTRGRVAEGWLDLRPGVITHDRCLAASLRVRVRHKPIPNRADVVSVNPADLSRCPCRRLAVGLRSVCGWLLREPVKQQIWLQ